MRRREVKMLAAAALAPLLCSGPAFGADIQATEKSDCRVALGGPIVMGDHQSLVALREHLVTEDGESTGASILCLDSPGGSLVEGLRMARFILAEGIGTRLLSGGECQSVCAIMFMMGNARGSEVSFINRRMHANSTLGFHRPYLSIEEAKMFTSGDIEAAYDMGITTIYELMSLANTPAPWDFGRMIEPDLFEMIARTPGSSMYEIRTVEQAIRWQIGIDGVPDSALGLLRSPHIVYACENALSANVALTSVLNRGGMLTDEIFEFVQPDSYYWRDLTSEMSFDSTSGRYTVKSPRASYSGIGCDIKVSDESVEACGVDQSTNVRLGSCNEEWGMEHFSKLVTQHPRSDLRALTLVADTPPDAITFRRCRVLGTGGEVEDDEICLHSVVTHRQQDNDLKLRHTLVWPSGARSVIDIAAQESGSARPVVINGEFGELTDLGSLELHCVRNMTSAKTVCSEAF